MRIEWRMIKNEKKIDLTMQQRTTKPLGSLFLIQTIRCVHMMSINLLSIVSENKFEIRLCLRDLTNKEK